MSIATTVRGTAVMPGYRREQAGWRAAATAVASPKHVPAVQLERDADFAHSGARGGGPPV